jgi:A/G-specific adenine glycosylase
MTPQQFTTEIWQFYRRHKRDLPWRRTKNAYRILVSEVMLQQTQVDRVIPKYLAFLTRFPSFGALAKAPTADVLKLWQGLGYNRRALALKRLAQMVMTDFKGRLPKDPEVLQQLPGVGPYTAKAISTFVWNQPEVFIETNIRRVYLQYFFPRSMHVPDERLVPIITKTVDRKNPREWYYALMDYGSLLPKLLPNANRRSKHYVMQSKFEGSHRQVRGAILKILLTAKQVTIKGLQQDLAIPAERIQVALEQLEKEGFLKRQGNSIFTS